jgi:hypothetical protein
MDVPHVQAGQLREPAEHGNRSNWQAAVGEPEVLQSWQLNEGGEEGFDAALGLA